MKKLILSAAVALAITAPALADDACAEFEGLAEVVVKAKQRGLPMSKAMTIIGEAGDNPMARRILRALIMDAYKLPNFSSEEYRQKQVVEFRNSVASTCYKVLIEVGALD